jgi:hypothetical protein
MENHTIRGGFAEADLRKYAGFRKNQEISDIKAILKDSRLIDGSMGLYEHQGYRDPLAFDKTIVIDIQLSTGGDADGYKLSFDENKTLISGIYYWADWGVYEEIKLNNEELELIDNLYSVSDWLSCS